MTRFYYDPKHKKRVWLFSEWLKMPAQMRDTLECAIGGVRLQQREVPQTSRGADDAMAQGTGARGTSLAAAGADSQTGR